MKITLMGQRNDEKGGLKIIQVCNFQLTRVNQMKIVNQMGSFGEKRNKLFFRFCRPILDIFGFTLLRSGFTSKPFFALLTQVEFLSLYKRGRESLDYDPLFSVLRLKGYLCQRCVIWKFVNRKHFLEFPEARGVHEVKSRVNTALEEF